jgi:hypothetical protein
MRPDTNACWQDLPADWAARLTAALDDAGRRDNTVVYFRADDVGVPGDRFHRLVTLFQRHAVPLSLAVVPAWLTATRWRSLIQMTGQGSGLWCWHQHGWRHANHEPRGKKQEFGPARAAEAVARDLVRGRRRLETIMGRAFYPLFTPPWNRCSEITLALLAEMRYRAVSRSRNAPPPPPAGLPDLAVDVDLHTGPAASAAQGWQRLQDALAAGLRRPVCGIMIHHQRMNPAAFAFLERLLVTLRRQRRITLVDLRDFEA